MNISEIHSSSKYTYNYTIDNSKIRLLNSRNIGHGIIQKAKEIFLPQGYPNSVSDDYIQYQIWDTIQALASTVTSTIANQAVLKGFGVGDKDATLIGASMTWVLKNGTGLVGRITFAYWKGNFLDSDCKRWRLMADVLNDICIFLDILSSFLPRSIFPPLLCITSVGQSVVGIAGGATRAAMTVHQARHGNMADVSAKDSSQESLSNLLGLMINVIVVYYLAADQKLQMLAFFLLTAVHLFANFRAVRSLNMETFNRSRLHIVVQDWLQTGSIISVRKANCAEPVWTGLQRKSLRSVRLGCSLASLPHGSLVEQMSRAPKVFDAEEYLLLLQLGNDWSPGLLTDHITGCPGISLLLRQGSTSTNSELKAMFHAELLDYWLVNQHSHSGGSGLLSEKLYGCMAGISAKSGKEFEIVSRSLTATNQLFPLFLVESAKEGWQRQSVLLNANEWRFDFARTR